MPDNLVIIIDWCKYESSPSALNMEDFKFCISGEKALDISEKATYKYAQVFEFEFF
jgi:hypothetical protein